LFSGYEEIYKKETIQKETIKKEAIKKETIKKEDLKKAALKKNQETKKKFNFKLNINFQQLSRTLLNPRILIPGAVVILLAVVLLWVMSPSSDDADTNATSNNAETTRRKNLTKEELAQEEIKFQYQMDLVQRFYKNGDLQKAMDKLKEAEKIKQTPESKQLMAELVQKLSGNREEDAYKNAIAAGTLPPLEAYLKEFPSGRYVNQVEEQLNRLKELTRLKEEEQTRLLSSSIKLRSQSKDLKLDDVKEFIVRRGFFEQYYNPKGKFKNKFQVQTENKENVVMDYATGLMWHQSGSDNYLKHEEVQQWLQQLNKTSYAGYSDWRIPTLEEAVSLLANSEASGGLYLNKVFGRDQAYIWTSDTFEAKQVWAVDFGSGDVNHVDVTTESFLRPVRNIIANQ